MEKYVHKEEKKIRQGDVVEFNGEKYKVIQLQKPNNYFYSSNML